MPVCDRDIGGHGKLQHEADDPQNERIVTISVRVLYLHEVSCLAYWELDVEEEDVVVEDDVD